MYLVTAREMRELDRYTIEEIGLPGIVLMENAGRAVAEEIFLRFPKPKTATVLAGAGNNGGDGWVVARHLLDRGWKVHMWFIGSKEKMSADAGVFYQVCCRYAPVWHYSDGQKERLFRHLAEATVVVDALLGTGTRGGLRPPMDEVVRRLNQTPSPFVVSVDLPSGVDADTGAIENEAVRADLTVTFQYPKWGHYLRPGANVRGKLKVAEIGIFSGHEKTEREPRARLNTPCLWQEYAQPRQEWAHKGTYGHLHVIGGAGGMLGAVVMAGEAAYRMGAGYVTLTVPESERLALAAKVTQQLIWSWPGQEVFDAGSADVWKEKRERFSAVAVGPGLGRFAGEEQWLGQLMEEVEVPLVLDADALNILAAHPSLFRWRKKGAVTILTPHPGEMARLIGSSTAEVEVQRHQVARQLALKTDMFVVLKGRYTVIAFPDGKQVLNPTGSPALAKAGSGDLLTGMIGSLLAQRIPAEKAVPMAVYLHGKAGEIAGPSSHGVMVDDLLRAIARVRSTTVPY
ncbi:NAD(P)H-hydrate dehydratase [Thermoactinomyces sp. CICC 10523]|uniref:NAD(P)H-hydrate dehydratase n=1 Tax=Thermoactinomyces sp. CICC 10523 TaxID=2767428 RepID=UPI0018DDAADC|nr:NAD(P)H-hydrate dehydratase [Thermoactinomyces sp. CICC 10523]